MKRWSLDQDEWTTKMKSGTTRIGGTKRDVRWSAGLQIIERIDGGGRAHRIGEGQWKSEKAPGTLDLRYVMQHWPLD